jgi:hypothetical protein
MRCAESLRPPSRSTNSPGGPKPWQRPLGSDQETDRGSWPLPQPHRLLGPLAELASWFEPPKHPESQGGLLAR